MSVARERLEFAPMQQVRPPARARRADFSGTPSFAPLGDWPAEAAGARTHGDQIRRALVSAGVEECRRRETTSPSEPLDMSRSLMALSERVPSEGVDEVGRLFEPPNERPATMSICDGQTIACLAEILCSPRACCCCK